MARLGGVALWGWGTAANTLPEVALAQVSRTCLKYRDGLEGFSCSHAPHMYHLVSATTMEEGRGQICYETSGEWQYLPQQGLAVTGEGKTGYSTDMILQNHHTSMNKESKQLQHNVNNNESAGQWKTTTDLLVPRSQTLMLQSATEHV